MKTKCGFNAEITKLFNMRNVVHKFNVFADEGDPAPAPTPTPAPTAVPQINFEELIQKARKEEKDKLYTKISGLENKVSIAVEQHNNDLLALADKDNEITVLKQSIENLKKAGNIEDSDVVKTLKADLEKAQNELQQLKDSGVNEEELRTSIRAEIEAEYKIKFYKEQKIHEANGKIIPELVSGNTEEEINESVAKAMERYNQIVGSAVPAPKVNPTITTANPLSGGAVKTNEDAFKALLELDPLSPEYKEARKLLGFK